MDEFNTNAVSKGAHHSSMPSNAFSNLSPLRVRQLASQLSQWRGLLPETIQWDEDEPTIFPSSQTPEAQSENIDPTLISPDPRSAFFSTNIDEEPAKYSYAYDIQVAMLRTRYYYARYMVYRPFVYKVLHYPELVTRDDAENAAQCLSVCFLIYFFLISRLILTMTLGTIN